MHRGIISIGIMIFNHTKVELKIITTHENVFPDFIIESIVKNKILASIVDSRSAQDVNNTQAASRFHVIIVNFTFTLHISSHKSLLQYLLLPHNFPELQSPPH